MDSSVEAFILLYGSWIAAAGFFLYIGVVLIGFMGLFDPEDIFPRAARWVAAVMLLVPICMRIYFSDYMVLWASGLLCLSGMWISFRRKLGL